MMEHSLSNGQNTSGINCIYACLRRKKPVEIEALADNLDLRPQMARVERISYIDGPSRDMINMNCGDSTPQLSILGLATAGLIGVRRSQG